MSQQKGHNQLEKGSRVYVGCGREVFRITPDVLLPLRLVNTDVVHAHRRWERKIIEVNVPKVR